MVRVDEYIYDLMKKILDSYNIIDNLGESKDDLFTLDLELIKINGLLKVLLRKTDEFSNKNSDFIKLNKKIANYFENHFFENDICRFQRRKQLRLKASSTNMIKR